jgi:S-DNA-T family DNA segregation ATPase FtsK/SpoIIIE
VTRRATIQGVAATVLIVAAVFLSASFTLALLAPDSQNLLVILLRAPGGFFVQSFHVASFYVPAVMAAAAVLLLSRRVLPIHLVLLGASLLPFFSLAIAVRIGARAAIEASPITAGIVGAVGVPVGTAGSALLAALMIAGLFYLWYVKRQPAASALHRARRSETGFHMPRIRALLASPVSQGGPSSLVDLPDPDDEEADQAAVTEDAPTAHPTMTEPETVLPEAEEDDDEPLTLTYVNGRFEVAGDEDFEDADDDAADDDAEADTETSSAAAASRRRGGSDRIRPNGSYQVPIHGLLDEYQDGKYWRIDDDTRAAADTLRFTLEEFGIQAEVTGIRKGPVITMFEILPAPGVKLNKIVTLADNIALRLAASSVRIVAPIPGKHAVGIEIPNAHRAIVSFAELLQEDAFRAPRMEIPIALGKDIPGEAQIVDLTRMPHVLIAGATGSGKSVCVNSIICSILYRRSPEEVKMILIDPKIVELKFYNEIPHLLTPVVTDPKRAFQALQYCIYEMERRYTLLDALQVRDVQSYNRKIESKKLATEKIPYIVVIVDEFADLMATSGKELESTLARLAAMSRAVGIHLVLATQRPSTDVITGLIKANIPSRIAFMVASKVDSRIIIDTQGAEKLLGRGDMLFTSAWDPFPLRLQGAFLSEEEVERVVDHVKTLGEPEYIDDEIFLPEDDEDYVQGELEDPLMQKAIDIVVAANKASASYLQRRLKIGYNRAARMVEEMERLGIVGPQQGSKPREILGVPDHV